MFPDMIHSVDEQEGSYISTAHGAYFCWNYTEDEFAVLNIRQLYAPEVLETVEGVHRSQAAGWPEREWKRFS